MLPVSRGLRLLFAHDTCGSADSHIPCASNAAKEDPGASVPWGPSAPLAAVTEQNIFKVSGHGVLTLLFFACFSTTDQQRG